MLLEVTGNYMLPGVAFSDNGVESDVQFVRFLSKENAESIIFGLFSGRGEMLKANL